MYHLEPVQAAAQAVMVIFGLRIEPIVELEGGTPADWSSDSRVDVAMDIGGDFFLRRLEVLQLRTQVD